MYVSTLLLAMMEMVMISIVEPLSFEEYISDRPDSKVIIVVVVRHSYGYIRVTPSADVFLAQYHQM